MRVMTSVNTVKQDKPKITDEKILNIMDANLSPKISDLVVRIEDLEANLKVSVFLINELKNRIQKLEKSRNIFKRIFLFIKGIF